ncbi:MAG: hypothetical protein WDO24_23325 [Pseudomonadota bacterium]
MPRRAAIDDRELPRRLFERPARGKAPAALADAADKSWVRRIVQAVNQLLQGKLNASLAVTLTHGATSTTIADARISATSTPVAPTASPRTPRRCSMPAPTC